jgi:hypothetical protein
MKGVETVAVKVCSAMVGSEDKARNCTIGMLLDALALPTECCVVAGAAPQASLRAHGDWGSRDSAPRCHS